MDIDSPGAGVMLGGAGFFGRREILTGVSEITRDNLIMVLSEAVAIHNFNAMQIDYLYRYMRGDQPILRRHKDIRPEINNKIVENHAAEIARFTSAYFLGEPVTYVRRGDRETASDDINLLNEYMFFEDKSSRDMEMATWMAICGVGYRMVLPDREALDEPDYAPFEIDTPDPRNTFVVYSSGFGHKRMMAVRMIWRQRSDGTSFEIVYCGYTRTHYFEVREATEVIKWEPHSLREIPIFEYRLNMERLGSFEPALPLLDAINTVQSNRVDGLEQYVQSFLKFINCDVDTEQIDELKRMGAIVIKSHNGMIADVQIVSQELNQQQTQTLVDYLYDQVLVICGMPTTTKGGRSTSDTGQAVLLRDGWTQCEARARDTEQLFKQSEKEFLRLVLRIMRETRTSDLNLGEVECKFTRRQHDNLQSKTQSLIQMLQAGLAPEVAIATCGLFNDPMDVTKRSAEYLEKWKPVDISELTADEPEIESEATNTPESEGVATE